MMIVYGSIGCGWSSALIERLNNYDSLISNCNKLELVLLMDQDLELINEHMQRYYNSFPVYSNDILKIDIKKSDIYPQTFLYHKDQQIMHIRGVKKGMLTKILKKVGCLAE